MFAELKCKLFTPIMTTAVLEPPTVDIPTPDDGDTVLSAIDLSVKQKDQNVDTQNTVDTQNSTQNSDENDVPENKEISPSYTDTQHQPSVVPPSKIEVSPPGNYSDSGSMSDSLLSPRTGQVKPGTNINTSTFNNTVLGTNTD